MADSVDYIIPCYCGEILYASGSRNWHPGGVAVEVQYWPDLKWAEKGVDVHDPITECLGCGQNIKETEHQQYSEALDELP